MRRAFYILILFPFIGNAQTPVSIHQEQAAYYDSLGITADEYYTINAPRPMIQDRSSNCTLNKMVFGWHPYWMNGVEDNYQWNLISDFCYFSYVVDAATGNASTTHGFMTNDAVDTALARGINVHLCVTLFSGHATFFGSSTAQTTLINNLVSMVQTRGAHGVNIDFEGVPSSQGTNLTNFMINLSNAMHTADPNYKVSIATFAVDWNDIFDEATLSQYVDYITIMGYDYYWSGSSQAGPVDPLYGFSNSYDRSLSRTVTHYLDEGMPPNQIVLGLPYYGREWETVSGSVPSSTTGNFVTSRTYGYVKDNISGNYSNGQQNQRSVSKTHIYQNSGDWRQCWITEGEEMRKRYDLVNQRGLGGIAIWALGYDDGYTDLWDAIEEKFTDCAVFPCQDTIYDGGGPVVDYYNDEDYAFTIAPDGATQVTLDFLSFETEANYDTLWLYDGPSVNAPLIGYYHGTTSPGLVTSSGSSLTLRFKSDVGTRAAGWVAVQGCIQDNIPPVTQVSIPGDWVTQDFAASFTDTDNMGIGYPFWNVADYDGTEWRSNGRHGFFTDNFNQAIHPDWYVNVGAWSIINNKLEQSNESENNTNIFAYVNQDTADVYLYEWKGISNGTGSNRRSGFHFFCDDAFMDNRGDSYFVWFRLDDQKLQIFKTISDVFFLQHEVDFTTVAGQEYFYRVIYSKVTGKIDVYVDGTYVTSWTDANPHQTGQHVSFRSGNSNYAVDDFKVYALRTANELISVGDTTAMIRYQNPNPVTPSGRVSSVITDQSHQFSIAVDSLVNVDWTAPVTGSYIYDSYAMDTDTAFNVSDYGANWESFSDPHSGVVTLYYGVGTIPGVDNIIPWTNNALLDSCTYSTAGFINEAIYYTSVYAINDAGLISDTLITDGYKYLVGPASLESEEVAVNVYPNPTSSFIQVNVKEPGGTLSLYTAAGRLLHQQVMQEKGILLSLSTYAEGIYFLHYGNTSVRILKIGN